MEKQTRIKYFPVSYFSVILGLTGFAIAFQKAEAILKFPFHIGNYIFFLAVAIFSIFSIAYLLKLIKFPEEVKKEFNSPIKLSFFPTISISLILFSIASLSLNKPLSLCFWVTGTLMQFLFTVAVMSIWVKHTNFEIHHINPAWFIPIVGNILVPIAGIVYAPVEISWFFFSIGFIFWVALFTIILYRSIFHSPIPDKLLPTFFILIAPPAVGFVSYVKLTGEIDTLANMLYYFALFLSMMLFAQSKSFSKINFYLSWWAYSFPVAAMTIASILMYHETSQWGFAVISYIFLAILTFIIIILSAKTLASVREKKICIEDE